MSSKSDKSMQLFSFFYLESGRGNVVPPKCLGLLSSPPGCELDPLAEEEAGLTWKTRVYHESLQRTCEPLSVSRIFTSHCRRASAAPGGGSEDTESEEEQRSVSLGSINVKEHSHKHDPKSHQSPNNCRPRANQTAAYAATNNHWRRSLYKKSSKPRLYDLIRDACRPEVAKPVQISACCMDQRQHHQRSCLLQEQCHLSRRAPAQAQRGDEVKTKPPGPMSQSPAATDLVVDARETKTQRWGEFGETMKKDHQSQNALNNCYKLFSSHIPTLIVSPELFSFSLSHSPSFFLSLLAVLTGTFQSVVYCDRFQLDFLLFLPLFSLFSLSVWSGSALSVRCRLQKTPKLAFQQECSRSRAADGFNSDADSCIRRQSPFELISGKSAGAPPQCALSICPYGL
ncbi:hypothetical protein WMY93_032576 [Mugilogobius chulae]|uniref:Uncharacterized protein n=1 Tax=Mugilogobius chulae TaxID=88201 RepID=A0AAW0MWE4_9GOBI